MAWYLYSILLMKLKPTNKAGSEMDMTLPTIRITSPTVRYTAIPALRTKANKTRGSTRPQILLFLQIKKSRQVYTH